MIQLKLLKILSKPFLDPKIKLLLKMQCAFVLNILLKSIRTPRHNHLEDSGVIVGKVKCRARFAAASAPCSNPSQSSRLSRAFP